MSRTIDDAVRDLVQRELGDGAPGTAARVGPRDAFWAFIVLLNVGLLVWSMSPSWFQDERFKVLTDVLPWVAGAFFAVTASWFRDLLLRAVSTTPFRAVNLVLLALLGPIQFPIVPLRVQYEPSTAIVRVNGNPLPPGGFIALRSQTLQLTAPNSEEYRDAQEHRVSMLDVAEQAVSPGVADYRWRLKTRLTITLDDQDSGATILVTAAIPFTAGFEANNDNVERMVRRSAVSTELSFVTSAARLETEVVGWFPAAAYAIAVSKQGCETWTRKDVNLQRPQQVLVDALRCTQAASGQ